MIQLDKNLAKLIASYYLSIDEFAYMYSKIIEEDWDINLTPGSMNKLKRLNLLENETLTDSAIDLLASCLELKFEKPVQEDKESKFEEFWKLYPRDDGNNQHSKTRQLRWNKPETKKLFLECEKSADELINALNNEINFRKAPSKENMFAYMCNSVNYFKKKAYETFLTFEEDNIDELYGKEIQ